MRACTRAATRLGESLRATWSAAEEGTTTVRLPILNSLALSELSRNILGSVQNWNRQTPRTALSCTAAGNT
eukprot:2425987-Pyramimonas_sp.AAC.1